MILGVEMVFLLKQLFGLVRLLNSETGQNQIAAGVACGLILGFAPAFSLQTVLVILILLFFRIQIGAATLAAFFFSFIAYLLDPVHNLVGIWILSAPSLQPLFTQMYNMPIVPFTRFSNSIVMGSGVVSVILALPVFFISRSLINKYRATVVARFSNTKFFRALQRSTLYNWYTKYQELYG
jgi:uncharacterized protein (TIGR03546 family)